MSGVDRMAVIARWECPTHSVNTHASWVRVDEREVCGWEGCGELLAKVEYVPANDLKGAVEAIREIAKDLRALGEEYRDEYPDGRVAKRELNEVAARLDAIGGQYR